MPSLPRLSATSFAITLVLSVAPAFAGSTPLAGYVPKDGLVGLVEFDGVEAHSAAWSKTAASQILNETTTGAMLEDLAGQLFERAIAASPSPKPTGAEMAAVLKHMGRSGFVLSFVSKPGAPNPSVTLVFRGALKADSKLLFGRILAALRKPESKVEAVTKPGDRRVAVIHQPTGESLSWWIEKKEDLVITNDPDSVIAVLDGKSPSAVDHPTRAALMKAEGGVEALGAAFVDLQNLPGGPGMASALLGKADLKGVQRIELGLGLQDEALRSEWTIVAPSPRTGALALLDGPGLDLKALPPLPEGVREFSAVSIDAAKFYGQILAVAHAINPESDASFAKMEATVKARTKLRLKEDVLGRIGPRMIYFTAPSKPAKAGPLSGIGAIGWQVPRGGFLIEMKDPKATTRMADDLLLFANKELRTRMAAAKPPADDDEAAAPRSSSKAKSAASSGAAPEFKVAVNNPKTWMLHLPPNLSALTNLKLTISYGKKYLVIGTQPDAAREAMAVESKGAKPLGADLAKVVAAMPSSPWLIVVEDPRDSLPEGLAQLPADLQALLSTPKPPPVAGSPPGEAPPPRGDRGRGEGGPKFSVGAVGGAGPRNAGGEGNPPAAPGAAPSATGAALSPIQIDPSKIPSPDAIRKLLFPAAMTVSTDAQGLHVVSRVAFPDFVASVKGASLAKSLPTLMQNGIPGLNPPPAGPAVNAPGNVPGGKKGKEGGGGVSGID